MNSKGYVNLSYDDFMELERELNDHASYSNTIIMHPAVYIAKVIEEFLYQTSRRNWALRFACNFITGKQIRQFADQVIKWRES